MIALLLRRFLWAIPTLVGVVILTFALQHAAPGDRVAERISQSNRPSDISRVESDALYRSVQEQLALDRPTFYASVRPHYQPEAAYDIAPLAYRKNLLQLNREVRNWSAISDYQNAVARIIANTPKAVPNYINDLQTSNSINQLKSIAIRIPAQEKDLIAAIQALSPSQSQWTYPVISWNGTHNQFHHWMTHLFDSDLRVSKRDGRPATETILSALSWTLLLSMTSLILAILLSLLIALLQERYRGGWFDKISTPILYGLYALPLFWLATLAVVFFTTDEYGAWTNIFPSIGLKYWMNDLSGLQLIGAKLSQLVLPIIVMTLGGITYLTKQIRADLDRQRQKPYVMMALAKGVSQWRLLTRHILPNAMIPFITIVTGAIPRTIVGSIVIEVIFNVPGMGKLLIDSITHADWVISMSIVLVVGVATVLSYLLADVLYMIFYPQLASQLIDDRS